MAATIVIACPACNKQLKGPADLQGKKVRCKACGHIFSVKAAPPAAAAKSPAKTKAAKPSPAKPQDSDQAILYKISADQQSVPRCPHCAFEMEPGQIVCLECGYNIETRHRATTLKTYQTSKAELTIWLLPGILAATYLMLALGAIAFLWFGLDRVAGDAWYAHFSIKVYGSVLLAFTAWAALKFALKRLVKEPRPPERIKV